MTPGRLAVILHNPVFPDARPDDADLLDEMGAVEEALEQLGWRFARVPFDEDIALVKRRLEELSPTLVCNLVEAFGGKGAYQYLAPAFLSLWGYRYTGGSADALFITTDKILAKEILASHGIPTPPYFALGRSEGITRGARYIVKPIDEDASLGIGPDSVIVPTHAEEIVTLITQKEREYGVRHFAERYIEGREFNLTILGKRGEPEVLPPAEIRFVDFDEKRPKIVDYRAKWDEGSFEYQNTRRSFDFSSTDRPLLENLSDIAIRCWRSLRLSGYARVDMRVDESGVPWVIEVNVNPCISPSGGVASACARGGISYSAFVERIIAEALL